MLSHEIGKMLKLDNYLIPTTSFTKDGKRYVASPMLEGEPLFATRMKKFNKGKASDQIDEIMNDEDIKKIAIFDFLIKNTDRHTGNIFVTDQGIKMIDHELSFSGFEPYIPAEAPALQGVMRFVIKNRVGKENALKLTQKEVDEVLAQKEKMIDMAREYFFNLPDIDEITAKRYLRSFKNGLSHRMSVFENMKSTQNFSADQLLGPEAAGKLDFMMNMIVNK